MIRILQALCLPGGTKNEDGFWHGASAAAVLDGSTSLIPCSVDGTLFTSCFLDAFAALADRGAGLCSCVNGALEELDRRFGPTLEALDWGYFPSAAGIFVMEAGPYLEIVTVGDCSGAFLLRSGVEIAVRDNRVKELDGAVLERMGELARQKETTPAALAGEPDVRNLLIENRRRMNRPGGYRVLAHGMAPCGERDVIRLPAEEVERFALWTDGFDAEAGALLKPDVRLEDVYARLREAEARDPGFTAMPRFKPGDDATALIARVE